MLQEYKSKFPKWCSDDTTPFSCCLSDDLDSLLSCRLLEKIKGYPINYFYDFTNLYQTENANGKALGVDIDCECQLKSEPLCSLETEPLMLI
jgi:hypothetical protein